MGQFLVLHAFFEATSLLPKEAFPRREVSAFEQSVLENTFNTAKSLNHVRAVVVQVPQLSVVFLVRPPKRILFEYLVLLEILPNSPALVVSQCEAILLE